MSYNAKDYKIKREIKKINENLFNIKYKIVPEENYYPYKNLIIEHIDLNDFINLISPEFSQYFNFEYTNVINNMNIFSNGFQSWAKSFETNANKNIKYNSIFKPLNKFILRDKTNKNYLKNHIISHDFIYFKNRIPEKLITKKVITSTLISNDSKIKNSIEKNLKNIISNNNNIVNSEHENLEYEDFKNNSLKNEDLIKNNIENKKLKNNIDTYLSYLFILSKNENSKNNIFIPVTFYYNQKNNNIIIELYSYGKIFTSIIEIANLYVFYAKDFFDLKEKLKSIYNEKDKTFKIITGWESWYNHYTNINQKLIENNLNSLYIILNNEKLLYSKKTEKIFNKDSFVFQIDDGWEKEVGDWEPDTKKFPRGLKYICNKIKEKGFIPGLWIAPFVVTKKSSIFKNNYNWILKNEKGKLITAGFNPGWGGYIYILDLSHPEVISFIKNTFEKIIFNWNFKFLKLDFLYAGLIYGNFYKKTAPFENYINILKIITSFSNVTFLGCGAPFEISQTYLKYMRIGADTKEIWEDKFLKFLNYTGRPSAYNNLINSIELAFLNNTVFNNDSDVFFIRKNNIKLTKKEKEIVFITNFLTSNVLMFSDDIYNDNFIDYQFLYKIDKTLNKILTTPKIQNTLLENKISNKISNKLIKNNENKILNKMSNTVIENKKDNILIKIFKTLIENEKIGNNRDKEFDFKNTGILKLKKDFYLLYDKKYNIKGLIDLKNKKLLF